MCIRDRARLVKFNQFSELENKFEQIKSTIEKDNTSDRFKANILFTIKKLLTLCKCKVPDGLEQLARYYTDEANKQHHIKRDQRVINTHVTSTDLYEWGKTKFTQHDPKIAMLTILRCCPIRISEFENMSTVDDGNNNYIDLAEGKLVVKNHKTSKGNKPRYVDLDALAMIDLLNFKGVLFPGKTDKQLQDMFTYMVNRFKIDNNIDSSISLGIHELRAAAEIKNFEKLNPAMSSDDIESLSNRCQELGHSMVTALKYYTSPNTTTKTKINIKLKNKDSQSENEIETESQSESQSECESEKECESQIECQSESQSESETECQCEAESEPVRILHHQGDVDKPNKLYVLYSNDSMKWIDIVEFPYLKHIELLIGYKKRLFIS